MLNLEPVRSGGRNQTRADRGLDAWTNVTDAQHWQGVWRRVSTTPHYTYGESEARRGQGLARCHRASLLFSRPVVFSSLRPHELPCARHPCPSPSPGVCPSSCSLCQWCCLAISSSDALFSLCPRSFPGSGTFPQSHLFTSNDQNTGASASASVLPVTIQGWSPLGLTVLISLLRSKVSTENRSLGGFCFCFLVLLKYSWFTMLCLISVIQQSDSVIHTHTYILFHILFCCGLSQDIEYNSLCYIVAPCCSFYI